MASFLEDLTEMRNNLICQICKNPARPEKKQWYRCMNLHQICQDCKGKNEKCSCGHPISFDFCKMTEKLLSIKPLKLNCFNAKNGCQEVLAENALEDHESQCIYRLVPCLIAAFHKSERKVTFQDVIQQHEELTRSKLQKLDLNSKALQTLTPLGQSGASCYLNPIKCSLNNQIFLLAGKTEDKIMYKWVYILGSLNEAKHFTFKLALFGTKVTTTFEGPVSAIDESFDALFEAGKCFAIPHNNFIAQIVNENNEYYCSLEIRNLKEEVKDENYESGISDSEDDTKK